MSLIYTTIGVYLNGDIKSNGVKPEHLSSHIKYNKTMRFGRALIVDGNIVHYGYWKHLDLQNHIEKTKLKEIKIKKCTAPYH